MTDCAHMVAWLWLFLCVFCVVLAGFVWHMHVWLLYELVLLVCECGRGRTSACQYVLMLHIWFPNFPPCSSPPPPCQDTVLFFQGGGVMEGISDEWWPCTQDVNNLLLFLCLSLFFVFLLCGFPLYSYHPVSRRQDIVDQEVLLMLLHYSYYLSFT